VGYNCTASLTIKVVKSVETVRLYPEEETLTLATNEIRLRAIISPADATNKKITYTTTNPLVATVSNDGVVKFLKAGQVVITVITEDGDFRDSITLIYTGGYPISLQIENNKIETDVSFGSVYKQINYSFSPENPPLQNITFMSNNESVATVNKNGLVHIFGGGSATITVKVQTSDNLYYFAYIEVSAIRKIDSITFESDNVITATSNYTINPICNPFDATDIKNLSFEIVSGTEFASVSQSGLVTFVSAGQIIVKATDLSEIQTESVSALITITYTGGYPSEIVLDNENIELKVGQFNYITFALFPIETSIREYYFEILSQTPVYGSNEVVSLDTLTGKITGLSGGSALIKVYIKISEDEWVSKTCFVNVTQDITKIEVDCNEEIYEEKYISASNTFNFTTTIYPADATNTDILFELSNTDIATIINNNQIYFNTAGIVTLTIYSAKNNNIKAVLTFWYTGNCAINATINGIPDQIVNGDDSFSITISNVIPANAINKSFKLAFSNQTTPNMFSVSYNQDRTQATVYILNSGEATLSLLLASADGLYTTLTTKNIQVKQKVDYIAFPYISQMISSNQFNLQCEIFPSNATQREIVYSVNEEYRDLANIIGNILTFNNSQNETETVVITATLTDIDGSIKTSQMEITTTFGTITAPEGNSVSLSVGNSVEYDYSSILTNSTILNIVVKSGLENVSYTILYGRLTISALSVGISEVEVQLLNKTTNELIDILATLNIQVSLKIENITISSDDLTKIGNKFVTAQNDILLNIGLSPEEASLEGLIINISNPNLATFNQETKILHFNSAGIIDITITSADGSCSRNFTIQYTNGAPLSYTLNIESDSNFYVAQNYLVSLVSFLPSNANLTISNITEVILSGGVVSIETFEDANGIIVRFNKAGTIKLKITLSDNSEKIVSINVSSTLSEIIFENETILTASNVVTLQPTLLPASATDKTLIYSISDPTIATVSNGVVTFLKSGTITITARSASNANVFATCQVKSTMGDVSEFSINYNNLILSVGETRNLIVNSFFPTNAANLNFIYEIISSIANDGSTNPIIRINGTTITCVKGGVAVVRVYIINQNNEVISQICNITCIRELTNISISFDRQVDTYQNYYITSLKELNILVNIFPADATINSQSLTIDNEDIAKIENGKLIFLNEGIIKLTARYNLKSTTITIRYTKSAVGFEIDDSSTAVVNGVRNITLPTGGLYTVRIKNVIPYDLSETDITLTLYLNSPNYNNDIVCSVLGNQIRGENGGYAIYNVTVEGYTSPEVLRINVTRLATQIVTDENIVTANSSYPLSAYVLPYDTTNPALTYTVLFPATGVSVDAFGIVTFTKETIATIEIKNIASGITKIISITYDMGAKQITFENNIDYVFIGNTLRLVARITPYNAQNEPIEWSVSDPNLATIGSDGILTPKTLEGVVTVTAKLRNFPETVSTINISIYANIYVIAFDLKNSDDSSRGISGTRVFGMYSLTGKLELSNPDITGNITNTYIMSVKSLLHNSSAVPALNWTTSDPSIATVDKGIITILQAGTVTITCTPVKQFYSDPSRYVKASYTFTFIEGLNVYTAEQFVNWRDVSPDGYNIPNGQSTPEIENLKLSKYYAGLPMVVQNDIVLEGLAKTIKKDIYGNGYRLDLQLKLKPQNSPFEIKKSVTINNVNFRGYTFESGDSLTSLMNISSVINIHNPEHGELNVTFKNCIIDGGLNGLDIRHATVNFSGCIIKNAYFGNIALNAEDKDKPRNIINVKNTIIENSLFGSILNLSEANKSIQRPLITFSGNVYLFNWQDLSQYQNFTLEGDFAVFSPYLANEIRFALESYQSKFKIKNGIKYAHFGILSPSINANLGPVKLVQSYDCEFINNSNIAYGLDIYTNTIAIGSYYLKNYGLNSTSTTILPGDSYMNDTLGYYKRIRDLT
jgi:uncharacterized protein YjdB